ncbi:hypothetical protein [Rugamonas rivuli]|uniref:Uncharacterized protein n=1 Tax=Rugamonas rivuli TaxID=2743358 RepID=A0A843S906_9BURK|nr:hypothetical protein [Rugamonas rivuli]MQA19322.1 hypothetical protein [Rugamonas rivuli]
MGEKVDVIDVFEKPYEVWSRRKTTVEEALELVKTQGLSILEALEPKDKLLEIVATHHEAAHRMLRVRADNGLEFHIDRALDESPAFRHLQGLMPQDVPQPLSEYQCSYPEYDKEMVDSAINTHGVKVAQGQFLFHGGEWGVTGDTLTTSKPFSTSFCPQVALRNAEWRGKAFDAGRVDLMVVRVAQPATNTYVYSREGEHGNEKEIVFASGAKLERVRETYVTDITAYKMHANLTQEEKVVPAYLVEVEIS